jgi:alpha-galactosidase
MTTPWLFRFLAIGSSVLLLAAANVPALDNGLAQTPPMGFNTWNWLGCGNSAGHGAIDEKLIKSIADSMALNGMAEAGYRFVNIDDCWAESSRDSRGGLVASRANFPGGIRPLVEYLHAKGLRLGMYTDLSYKTCAETMPGLYGHERQDCDTFAAWGIDYLKVDFCQQGTSLDPRTSYALVRDCLRDAVASAKAGGKADAHEIAFSICNWGINSPWLWGQATGNLWRTTADITHQSFDIPLAIMDANEPLYPYAGPGGWNDPDMLEVGNGFTAAEDRSHFSLWCMMAAPLITGNDVRAMSAVTRTILTNKEVIAVDQDSLGKQGRRVVTGATEAWVKLLTSNDRAEYALLFFNRKNSAAAMISVSTAQIATAGGDIAAGKVFSVRDVWNHADLPNWTAGGAFSTPKPVPYHDVCMLRLTPVTSTGLRSRSARHVQTDITIACAGHRVKVDVAKCGRFSIVMIDPEGRTLYAGGITGPGRCIIGTASFAQGVYFLTVRNGTNAFSERVLLK